MMFGRIVLFFFVLVCATPAFAQTKFRDCPLCPEMVVVPPGSFTQGSPSAEGVVRHNEGPQHKVTIPRAFAVAIYDVTYEQWDACLADQGCEGYRPQDRWGRGKLPVINVSFENARSYIRWLNSKLRGAEAGPPGPDDDAGPYRLLTESEWEYAARAGSTTEFYWGRVPGMGNANCDGCGSQWDDKQAAPVGSFPPNAFGLYDMAGNVLQWVQDCYHPDYVKAPVDGSAWMAGKCETRVLRGGSWYNSTYYLRSANRYDDRADFHGINVGFRVARTLGPAK